MKRSRTVDNELWFLSKKPGSVPERLHQKLSEGAAVSKRSMKIAYAVTPAQDPALPPGHSQLFVADVKVSGGSAHLANKHMVYESPSKACTIERGSRPPRSKSWAANIVYQYRAPRISYRPPLPRFMTKRTGSRIRIGRRSWLVLNHAIAAAMVHGSAKGLGLLEPLDSDTLLAGHYRPHAARGHLLENGRRA
ncbi:MAG: hypothetical protein ACRD45_05215 [Bryobacteraceae bacterium]